LPSTPTITRQELAEDVEETFEKLGLVERSSIMHALEYNGVPSDVPVDRSQP